MNRTNLVISSVTFFLVPVAGVSISSARERASASPTALHAWNDADDVSLPAGVTGERLTQARASIRQLQQLNPDVAVPLRPRPDWKTESNRSHAAFGQSVATAGDVNGDGYEDIIVGAPSLGPRDQDEHVEGRAYVYYGSAAGPSLTADWIAENNDRFAQFGYAVGTAGDVNGDGYDDVIVGAPWYSHPEEFEGGAFVYYGSASGLSLEPNWTAETNQDSGFGFSSLFGWSVGTAGDVNGDGYDDVVVGSPQYEHGEVNEGSVFVYYGSASGLSLGADWKVESNQRDSDFGYSVGTAGDVNGDGYDDLIVGAGLYTLDGADNAGRAVVYHGSASGLSPTPDWTADGDQADAHFGIAVGTALDVNGDGYDDVVVGAPKYSHDENGEGRAFVYYGSASGLSETPDWTVEGNEAEATLGNFVGTAGDVNGDGYDDIVIGEASNDEAFVYRGSASGLSTMPDWTVEVDYITSLGTAGDVNSDGYDEIIVGSAEHENGETDEGGAVVFRGRRR